jgi:type I restriction enzyme S subunit
MMEKKLPKDWKIVKVGKYVISTKGKKPKRISKEKTNECHLPYVNIKAFEKGVVDEYTDGVGCVICEEGDFLMVWDGSRSGYVGKAIKGALGSTLVRLDFPDLENNYAYYFLQSKYIEINTRAKGVGIPHVDPNLLWNYDLLIPPIETQQAIVSKIEELFSELDKGIEDLKTAQQQLKTYRQSVLKWAFEGKLTNENVKEGELPKGWSMAKMSTIIKLSSLKHKPEIVENLFYIGLEHIEKHTGKLTSSVGIEKITTIKNKFSVGDILYGKLRPNLNKVYLSKEEGVCSTDILVLKLEEKCIAKYLHQIMISRPFVNEMSENTSGVNLPRVSTKFIMNYEVPLPPVEEQHQIVQEIESRLSVADKMEESIAQSLQQAEALRQSILKKAFSGELV